MDQVTAQGARRRPAPPEEVPVRCGAAVAGVVIFRGHRSKWTPTARSTSKTAPRLSIQPQATCAAGEWKHTRTRNLLEPAVLVVAFQEIVLLGTAGEPASVLLADDRHRPGRGGRRFLVLRGHQFARSQAVGASRAKRRRHRWPDRRPADRLEVLQRRHAGALVDVVCNDLRVGLYEQRVSIGWCARDIARSDQTGSTGLDLNDDRLTEGLPQRFLNRPSQDVNCSTRGVGSDERDRLARPARPPRE